MRFYIQILILIAVLIMFSCATGVPKSNAEMNLSGTQWSSRMYFHHQLYFFENDSQGYKKHGSPAAFYPIDTLKYNISGDSIIYIDSVAFSYIIGDSLLILQYEEVLDTFFITVDGSADTVFRSKHEYAYGDEILYSN